jgi:hypothetical protein
VRVSLLAATFGLSFLLVATGWPQQASATGKFGTFPIWAGKSWKTQSRGVGTTDGEISLEIKFNDDGTNYSAVLRTRTGFHDEVSGSVDPSGKIETVDSWFGGNWAERQFSGKIPNFILENNGTSGGAIFKIDELIRLMEAKVTDPSAKQQATNEAPKRITLESSSIPYRSLPVGTRLTYGPVHETIVVKKIEDFETTYESSKIGPFKRYGNIVQVNRNPYSPSHSNLDIEIDKKSKKIIKNFWSLKVGNSIKYNLEETWNNGFYQIWTLVSAVKSFDTIKVNNKFYRAMKIITNGTSTENGGSNWAEDGRMFVETIWVHPSSGVLLKFERRWSGVEVSYGHPNGYVEELELVRAEFPEGSKVALNSIKGSKSKTNHNLASSQQPSSEVRHAAEAERQRLQQEIAALKKQNEEAHRLADLESKRKKEKVRHLAEAEQQRQEEDAQRLAQAKRKEEQALRLAAIKQKRKDEEVTKRQTAQKTTSAVGGSGKLQQQLSVLKQLRANGLINENEFASQKKALLVRFLGLKQGPPVPSATANLAPKETTIEINLAKYRDVKFGKYYALVIGSNEYKYLPKLGTAKTDAKDIAEALRSSYGFDVKLLTDATRDDILDAFDEYRKKLTDADNLLIYYAGHGWLDKEADRGYWLPVDAKSDQRRKWLSTADITDALKAMNAKHVMVMADSCYSGTLVRGIKVQENTHDYVRKMVKKRARLVITSGGLEPVADSAGGKNSPFASVFLDLLKSNKGVMDGTNMFSKMRRPVMLKADQTPEYSDVRKAGHDGGDFLFVRRR